MTVLDHHEGMGIRCSEFVEENVFEPDCSTGSTVTGSLTGLNQDRWMIWVGLATAANGQVGQKVSGASGRFAGPPPGWLPWRPAGIEPPIPVSHIEISD
jgi:hypothetical protein